MRFRLFLIPILAGVVLMTGCGSAKKTSAGAPTSSTSTTAFNPDTATAKKLVLTAADLPAGWSVAAAANTENNLAAGIYDQLTTCLTGSSDTSDRTLLYSGDSFTMNSSAISSGVSALKTVDQVSAQLKGINNQASYSCITSLFDNIVGRTLATNSAGGIPKSTITAIPGVTVNGSEFDLRIATAITIGGNPQSIYTDILGVAQGRFISSATVEFFGSTPNADLENGILTKLAYHARSAA